MAIAVVTKASGGMPVIDVTATKPGLGVPVTEATNGRGIAVTKVSLAIGGLPVTFVAVASAPAAPAWPDATNTGVPAGTTLTPAGTVDSASIGQVIDALDITGPVTISHNNVTLKRCKVTISTAFACVNILDGVTGVTIQDCTIDGVGGSAIRGISGGGTFLRNNISRVEDGIYVRGSGSLIQDNYIHTLLSSYVDPHYDGIANDGGFNGVTIKHNRINNPFGQTSCVMIDNFFGAINTVLVENNYLTGAGSNIFVDAQFSGTNLITNVTIKDNLLGNAVQGFYAVTGATPTFTGNYSTRGYYIDGGAPPLVGTQTFAPTNAITSGSDRNDNTGFRVAATLSAAIPTEFRLVFYTGATNTLVLNAVAFGKQSSGQVATAALVPVTFGGSTAASPIMAMQRYVVSDWMPKGALTFGVGDVMLVGFSTGLPGGTGLATANSNATSFFGSTANMALANPAYTTSAGTCYGLARIEAR